MTQQKLCLHYWILLGLYTTTTTTTLILIQCNVKKKCLTCVDVQRLAT